MNAEKTKYSQLPEKHKLFVDEYIATNFNASKAYVNVYDCDPDAARVGGSRLVTNVDIKQAINERIDEILDDKKELTLQVINEYKRLAFSDISEFIDPITGETVRTDDTRPVESLSFDIHSNGEDRDIEKRRIKLYNKQSALDSLAKLVLGMSEKKDIDVSGEIKIVIDEVDKDL